MENAIKNIYEFYFKTHDYDKWLNESFEESSMVESEFYRDKWNFSGYNMDKPEYSIWSSLLYERLKDSLEISEKDIDRIKQINGILDVKIENTKRLCFEITYDESLDEKSFISLMNFYGYTVNNIDDYTIRLEACIPKKLTYEKINHVYHVTTKSNFEKIKKFGIFPKRKIKYSEYYNESGKTILEYPKHIYCWKEGTSKELIKQFMKISKLTKPQNTHIDYTPVLLRINIGELNKYRDEQNKISFYTDPAYNVNNAIFTMEPIATKYIEQITIDDIDKNISERKTLKNFVLQHTK